ncbi:MAG: dTDP-4-dehydrorhamnose 3,5-epimerase family protein [Proteobacteria bacterium]|nr:dTDP-4-keto-6-deoxy-D-glucose epimerase [Pseudomonadota bacterium]NOG59110.1 dTDP-4-dehydrorhamnose 3,5-epimerase family protein [Pseudomonadota bacterium]
MSLIINETSIPGLFLIDNDQLKDHRGSFSRFFCKQELSPVIGKRDVVQINHSYTAAVGAMRGFHYQLPPYAEMKFVRCLKGKVWDVIVDLRAESPTFLKYHVEELEASENQMLVIPEGCAHGYQVLHADSELLYLHTEYYSSEYERGVRFNDPALDISWPLSPVDISERDLNHPLITPDFTGIAI